MIIWMLAVLAAQERDALDVFKQRMSAARAAHEKAAALRDLGLARDPAAVATLGRYLLPQANDVHGLLPVAAAEALSRQRGSIAATRALLAGAEALRSHPYLRARCVEALARVGHEAGLALFEDALRGPEAAAAVDAIAAFPPPVAAEALLLEARRIERRGGEDVDRLREALVRGLQQVTGERYPTLAEFELWWRKRGASFRADFEARRSAAPDVIPPRAPLLVELRFGENGGMRTANTGATAAWLPAGALGGGGPSWTGAVPVGGGPSALEWPRAGGGRALELGARGPEALKNLRSFTLSGWVLRTGTGDGALLSWRAPGKAGEGVELALRADGRLQLGIRQPAEGAAPASLPGLFPTSAADAWRFFAASYDSTSGQVRFYVGSGSEDAREAGQAAGPPGSTGARIAPALSIGGPGFGGVLDELRVHGSAADGTGVLGLDEIVRLQGRPRS